jgi:exosortase/archaeosortase family protein
MRNFWTSLPELLSPDWIINQNHAAPWGVLLLCIAFLFIKRKEIYRKMTENPKWITLPAGPAIIIAAIWIPPTIDLLLFKFILVLLGVFVIFFSRASRLPVILAVIYGFVIIFPLAVERYAEVPYAQTILFPLMKLAQAVNFPLTIDGQWLNLTPLGGQSFSVILASGCAGPATMAIFIALFTMMMLDMPLRPKNALVMFVIGVAGTWFQSFLRIIILMLCGYFLGEDALWVAHSWSTYILFPLWYLLFAYIYFRQVRKNKLLTASSSGAESS